MDVLLTVLPQTARILIGFYFTFFGIWNLYHWIPILLVLLRDRVPHPYFLMTLGICVQIIAGSMVMFNVFPQYAAWFLIPFNLLSICLFHPFWQYHGDLRKLHFTIFMSNATLATGALLWLAG